MSQASVDLSSKTVELEGTTYKLQELGQDSFTVLVEGVPVGRIVYVFGSANGVSESDTVSEETLTAVAEAWFAALDA